AALVESGTFPAAAARLPAPDRGARAGRRRFRTQRRRAARSQSRCRAREGRAPGQGELERLGTRVALARQRNLQAPPYLRTHSCPCTNTVAASATIPSRPWSSAT